MNKDQSSKVGIFIFILTLPAFILPIVALIPVLLAPIVLLWRFLWNGEYHSDGWIKSAIILGWALLFFHAVRLEAESQRIPLFLDGTTIPISPFVPLLGLFLFTTVIWFFLYFLLCFWYNFQVPNKLSQAADKAVGTLDDTFNHVEGGVKGIIKTQKERRKLKKLIELKELKSNEIITEDEYNKRLKDLRSDH